MSAQIDRKGAWIRKKRGGGVERVDTGKGREWECHGITVDGNMGKGVWGRNELAQSLVQKQMFIAMQVTRHTRSVNMNGS
jgi:hypothetical protein